MKSPHMFLAWFVLQELKPRVIVESGVYLGLGTWFFEHACPESELYCIDIDLSQLQYISKRAAYFDRDFSTIDWNHLPKEDTVLFFDDHQNAYERTKTAKWFGLRHLIFEDNYPANGQANCYSLKQAFLQSGFKFEPSRAQSFEEKLKQKIKDSLGVQPRTPEYIPPNDVDAKYLYQNLEIYHELPPIFKPERTRWNDIGDEDNYPTPAPLLESVEKDYQRVYFDEAVHYTWMCYARLK